MKTQATSKINFNSKSYYKAGRFLYKTRKGNIAHIHNQLPREFQPYIYEINKKVEQKPYNVIISRGEKSLDFNIYAETLFMGDKTEPIQVKLSPNRNPFSIKQHLNIQDLADAAYKSIDNMENKLHKQKKSFWEKIISKFNL